MKFRNQFFKYMSPEQGGEQGGGAGDGSNADNGSTGEGDGSSDGGKGSAEEGGKGSEDNTLLREIMKKKGKIQELEGKLESYADIDVDLYKTMLSERETAESERKKAEQQRLLDEGKYEELLKGKQDEHDGIVNQMNTAHKTELDEAATNYSKLEDANKALVAQIEELTVGAAFGNSTLIREDMISAMTPARVRTLYGAHFEPNENGEVIGYDKPTGVEGRAPIVNAEGKPVSFDAALKTILENQGDFDAMIRSKVNGSGSNTGNGKSEGGQQIGSGIARISHALHNKK